MKNFFFLSFVIENQSQNPKNVLDYMSVTWKLTKTKKSCHLHDDCQPSKNQSKHHHYQLYYVSHTTQHMLCVIKFYKNLKKTGPNKKNKINMFV